MTKPFQRENIIFYAFFEYIYQSWLFNSYYAYQLNSQSMGSPDKQKAVKRLTVCLVKKRISWNKPNKKMSASQKLQLLESDSST